MEGQNNDQIGSTYGGGLDPIAAIEAQANAHDQVAFAGQGAAPDVAAIADAPMFDAHTEAKMIYQTALALAAPIYPTLEKVYTPEQIDKLAAVSAPLMEKYGLNTGGFLEQWGAEIMFAMTVWPLGQATIAAIRYDKEMKAAKEAPANEESAEVAA